MKEKDQFALFLGLDFHKLMMTVGAVVARLKWQPKGRKTERHFPEASVLFPHIQEAGGHLPALPRAVSVPREGGMSQLWCS